MRVRQTNPPFRVAALVPLSIAFAVILVVAALWAWGRSSPAPGERAFSVDRIWAARSAAIGLSAAAQAVLFGFAVPAFYRNRPIYIGVAALAVLVAAVGAISAAAFAFANA